MVKDKVIKKVFEEIAKEYGITLASVEEIYESQWDFIHDTLSGLEFNTVSEEEFDDLKTNFNIPALGKLYTNFKRIKNVRDKAKESKEKGSSSGNVIQRDNDNSGEEEDRE